MNSPFFHKKRVHQIYDIEKMGVDNQSYLVEFIDNTMERLSVKYIKENYKESYV
jgi:hypothetical protein